MASRRYKKRRQASKQEQRFLAIAAAMALLVYFYGSFSDSERVGIITLFVILSALVIGLLAVFISYTKRRRDTRLKAVDMAYVDTMKGREFEDYIAALFRHQGYKVKTTKITGDGGVDLLLVKDGARTAVQAKRYAKTVGLEAVQQVVAGKTLPEYKATQTMVVSNRSYTKSAQLLAVANECKLIDREKLGEWILDFQRIK